MIFILYIINQMLPGAELKYIIFKIIYNSLKNICLKYENHISSTKCSCYNHQH